MFWHLQRYVVERPVHDGGETFRHAFLNHELADVGRRAPSVAFPTAAPLGRIVASLVDPGEGQAHERAVAQVDAEALESRMAADARLGARRVRGGRRDHEQRS